eukprot:m.1254289 g.1254289  ORF g.1254289 m.1254289 type:complete len:1928 (+) comp24707_c0_seq5:482-6265(+)
MSASSNIPQAQDESQISKRKICFVNAVYAKSTNMNTIIRQKSDTSAMEEVCSSDPRDVKQTPKDLLMKFKDAYRDILSEQPIQDRAELSACKRSSDGVPGGSKLSIFTKSDSTNFLDSISNLPERIQNACKLIFERSNSSDKTKTRAVNEILTLFVNMRNGQCQYGTSTPPQTPPAHGSRKKQCQPPTVCKSIRRNPRAKARKKSEMIRHNVAQITQWCQSTGNYPRVASLGSSIEDRAVELGGAVLTPTVHGDECIIPMPYTTSTAVCITASVPPTGMMPSSDATYPPPVYCSLDMNAAAHHGEVVQPNGVLHSQPTLQPDPTGRLLGTEPGLERAALSGVSAFGGGGEFESDDASLQELLDELNQKSHSVNESAKFKNKCILGTVRHCLILPQDKLETFADMITRFWKTQPWSDYITNVINSHRQGRQPLTMDFDKSTVEVEGGYTLWTLCCDRVGDEAAHYPEHAADFTTEDIQLAVEAVFRITSRMRVLVHEKNQKAAACNAQDPDHKGTAETETTPHPRPTVTVYDYLQGHVLRMAMIQFERGITGFVQHTMKKKFPGGHPTRGGLSPASGARLPFDNTPHDKTETATTPLWLHKCRDAVPTPEQQSISQTGVWSTLVIISVLNKYMTDVFASSLRITDVHEAKEMAVYVFQAVHQRSKRTDTTVLNTSPEDVLATIHRLYSIATRCHTADSDTVCSKALDALQRLVDEAESWMSHIRVISSEPALGKRVISHKISAADCVTKILHSNLVALEELFLLVMGKFQYTADGSISFGDSKMAASAPETLLALDPHFRQIAEAHTYYVRSSRHCPNLCAVDAAMRIVAKELPRAPCHEKVVCNLAPLRPSDTIDVVVEPLGSRMLVPMARVPNMVGRQDTIQQAISWLVEEDAAPRILIHGIPGVGKDVMVAEVVHDSRVRALGGLQCWIQASTDALLQRQLLEVFCTHRPHVVQGAEHDMTVALPRIASWLKDNADWTFVFEDVSTEKIWDILPPPECHSGRVVLTSQQPLHTYGRGKHYITHTQDLQPVSVEESLDMLKSMHSLMGSADACGVQAICNGRGEDSGSARAQDTCQLQSPELREFIEQKLGNLPLSVALCASIMRSDPSVRCVLDLIQLFERQRLKHIESVGHHPSLDHHYLGLTTSVRVLLTRLDAWTIERGSPHVYSNTLSLLVVVGLLDRAKIPLSLLLGHDVGALSTAIAADLSGTGNAVTKLQADNILSVFREQRRVVDAINAAERFGFLRGLVSGMEYVGVMHQSVHRIIREYAVECHPKYTQIWCTFICNILHDRFTHAITATPTSRLEALRDIATCVGAFCSNVQQLHVESESTLEKIFVLFNRLVNHLLEAEGNPQGAQHFAELSLHFHRKSLPRDDTRLVKPIAKLATAYDVMGMHQSALPLREEALKIRVNGLQSNDPHIAASMSNLAVTYSSLGMHEKALELQMRTLKFHEEVLCPDHPDIATSKSNLAESYSALGLYSEALKAHEAALAFRKRVLHEDHPHIATSIANVACAKFALGRHREAYEQHTVALEFYKRVYPPDHVHIASQMSSLASTSSAIGMHTEALKLQEEVLERYQKILPEGHPSIATSMGILASLYYDAGKYKEALQLGQEALEQHTRTLSSKHPHVLTSMSKLAVTYLKLDMRKEALQLNRDTLLLRQEVLHEGHPHIGASMGNLAITYYATGMREEAVALQKDTVAFYQRVLKEHPDTATAQCILAAMYRALQQHSDARSLYKMARRTYEKVYHPEHPSIAAVTRDLAETLNALGEHSEALELQQKSLDTFRRILPPDHPQTVLSMAHLAKVYGTLGMHENALALQEAVLTVKQEQFPPQHTEVEIARTNLFGTCHKLGKHPANGCMVGRGTQHNETTLERTVKNAKRSMHHSAHHESAYCSLGMHNNALKLHPHLLKLHGQQSIIGRDI